jgi:drug/metabolite transporter (DMT)-like permease
MPLKARTRKLALFEGATAGTLFGTAAVFIRFLQALNAFSIAFWRLVIACCILAAILLFSGKPPVFKNFRLADLREPLVLGFLLGLHFIFFISAVKDTTILNATVLVNTTPIFSMLISTFIFRARASRTAVMGIAVSIIGVCVIAYAESMAPESVADFSPSLKGDFEAVSAALLEALYLSYGKKVRGQRAILPIMLPIYMFAAVTVSLLGLTIASVNLNLPTEPAVIFPLLGLGAFPTAIAHTLYFSSLSNLRSFETATMALLEPVGATALGALLFGEVPAPLFIFGAALVLLGITFMAKGE